MKFIKYPSLTNHYVARKQSFIDMEDEYVSTEKIHGSNISIIIDNNDNIDVAKRTAFLTESEREQRPWNTLATFAEEQKELIAVYNGDETGGTANAVKYAIQKNKKIEYVRV